jgi:hypothetical protein
MSKKNTVDTETAETESAQSEPVAEETAKTVEAAPAAAETAKTVEAAPAAEETVKYAVIEQPAKKSCNCVSRKDAEARNFRNQEILLNWNRSV